MAITTTDASLLRLLQLSSVSLPVGGFAFSQGLETAIELGWVNNAEKTKQWLNIQLQESVARVDLPVLQGAMLAWTKTDSTLWNHWNDLALANRETKELRLADTAMGEALCRLLKTLEVPLPTFDSKEISFVALWAVVSVHWNINFDLSAYGFMWSWLENQITAATKLVPLGQSQAQILLGKLQTNIPSAIELSQSLNEDSMGGSLPMLAISSSLHEIQYTRLFRS
jgi:urease accessory protein